MPQQRPPTAGFSLTSASQEAELARGSLPRAPGQASGALRTLDLWCLWWGKVQAEASGQRGSSPSLAQGLLLTFQFPCIAL